MLHFHLSDRLVRLAFAALLALCLATFATNNRPAQRSQNFDSFPSPWKKGLGVLTRSFTFPCFSSFSPLKAQPIIRRLCTNFISMNQIKHNAPMVLHIPFEGVTYADVVPPTLVCRRKEDSQAADTTKRAVSGSVLPWETYEIGVRQYAEVTMKIVVTIAYSSTCFIAHLISPPGNKQFSTTVSIKRWPLFAPVFLSLSFDSKRHRTT